MSLVDDISGEQTQQLAVLYCDLSPSVTGPTADSEMALWRVNCFRAAREAAADYGGREATTATDGWAATFSSTVEALICARALSSLLCRQADGPSLSGGLSAGDVTREPFGISGRPVWEAIALCHRAHPRQVLVANPLLVVEAPETASSFAPGPQESLARADGAVSIAVGPRRVAPGTAGPPGMAAIAGGIPWARAPRTFDRVGDDDHTGLLPGDHPDQEPSLRLLTSGDGSLSAGRATATHPARIAARPSPAWATARLLASAPVAPVAPVAPMAPMSSVPAGPALAPASWAASPTTRTASVTTSPADAPGSYPDPGTTGVRLTILGWVQLETGEPATRLAVLRGSQARAVLSMLALRRGPVHKAELAELLWPRSLPEHWEGALRGLITKVRRFLDAGGLPARPTLAGEGGYYELRLPPGVAIDRDVASGLIASAQAALTENHPVNAGALVRRAVTILERRLLSGPDNPWFDQVRAELAHDRLTALELCARAELAAGGIEGAKRAALEAMALDHYRESSYRLLMQAHAAAGSRGEALRTYERCRRMLAEELGVGPAAETQALYLHLLG